MVDIHLCQPDSSKSCAACCGIYNYVENTCSSLVGRFNYRTHLFSKVRKSEINLDEYRDIIRHREDSKRIYKTIYACEFVGFLNEDRTRVGCMLHPMSNDGNDFRDISFYGRDICEGHFCPSYQQLTNKEALTVITSLKDWYLYGSVITDIDFVKTFFKIVQDRLGEEISPDIVEMNKELIAVLNNYYSLKVQWPFRDTTKPRFGKYYFVGEEYDIDRIDYELFNSQVSLYDPIFLSLSSRFTTKAELDRATVIIDMLIEGFCNEYARTDREYN